MKKILSISIERQPNDVSCGATCLYSIYHYYEDDITLEELLKEVKHVDNGGTLALLLGINALKRGYKALLITYNVDFFDPSWFVSPGVNIVSKLRLQKRWRHELIIQQYTPWYLDYIKDGGSITSEPFTEELVKKCIDHGDPLLIGVNVSYLYGESRIFRDRYNDIRGMSEGHFVIICGYDTLKGTLLIADPWQTNPFSLKSTYWVKFNHLITSMMLGVLTHDANVLVISKIRT